jgi:hypothetical protein
VHAFDRRCPGTSLARSGARQRRRSRARGPAPDAGPASGFRPAAAATEGYEPGHELFDLAADPGQEYPLSDDALEGRFRDLMREQLRRVAAPQEHLARLGP